MLRRLTLTGLTLTVWASLAFGQGRVADIFIEYDLDAVAVIYCDTTNVPALIGACVTGVAATDGWIDTSGHRDKTVAIVIDTIGVVGGIDVTFQVRYRREDGTFTSAIPLMALINKTTADTDNQSVRIPDEVSQFRVGLVIGTADDGADAIVEVISVIYNAR